jgi:hypothetical protein
MSFTITTAFIQQFTGTVRFIAQQMDSRLRGKVLEDQVPAESGYLEQLAPTAARKRQSRGGDSPIMNTQHLRRRVAPYDYEWGDLIDKLDKVRLLIDPTSAYSLNAGYAMNRGVDDELIASFFANAYAGHSGSTVVTWPAGDTESTPAQPAGTQVAVGDWTYGNGSGNAGLTISKLIYASVALDQAEGDENEERFILVGAKQKGNLLSTTEATNSDYAAVKALVEGKIKMFMGFTFVHSERMLTNASGYTRVPAWRKSAMGLGIAQDIETQLAQRADKSFAWYPYASMAIGGARLEEQKLVELICA